MKILHPAISSTYFPVLASRNKTSENPLAFAWLCARKTYIREKEKTKKQQHSHNHQSFVITKMFIIK